MENPFKLLGFSLCNLFWKGKEENEVFKMKRKLGYVFVVMTFALVFVSQIVHVKATTQYTYIDNFHANGLYMYCRASIWAAPKAGGGYYMDHQYFNVDVASESGCGICEVTITINIQGQKVVDEVKVVDNGLLTPDWGPDDVYDNYWNYYFYKTSTYAVWASIDVFVIYKVGSSYYLETITAEASYGS